MDTTADLPLDTDVSPLPVNPLRSIVRRVLAFVIRVLPEPRTA